MVERWNGAILPISVIGTELALKPPSPTRTSRLAHLMLKSWQYVFQILALFFFPVSNSMGHVGSNLNGPAPNYYYGY